MMLMISHDEFKQLIVNSGITCFVLSKLFECPRCCKAVNDRISIA